jgi:hypothetical protein
MRRAILTALCLTGMLCLVPGARAVDDIQALVGLYTADNAAKYLQPLADALGADMNGGFYHGARVPVTGFHLCVGVEAIFAPIADEARTFRATTEAPFNPPATADASTLFGPGESATATGTGGTVFIFPGGFDIKRLPLVVPQITVGSFMGTEATVRFADIDVSDSIGKLRLLSLGARHNVSQYLPSLPVDLAAGFFWQHFEVGDLIDAKTLSIGAQGSITRSVLTLYGGLAWEKSTLDVSYPRGTGDFEQRISFSMDGKNKVRFTAGAALKLAVLTLHADYSLASQSTIALGVGLGN